LNAGHIAKEQFQALSLSEKKTSNVDSSRFLPRAGKFIEFSAGVLSTLLAWLLHNAPSLGNTSAFAKNGHEVY
jgi:hypothetical protein